MSTMANSSLPPSVSLGQKLIYGLVGFMVLRTLLTIVLKDDIIDHYLAARNSSLPREVAEDGAPAYVAISIISLVIFGGLLAFSAYMFKSGAGWARIVAVVMAVLTVIGGLSAFAQDAPGWFVILNVLAALIALAVIVVLFRPDASEWFRKTA
ncbi:hypothetical protein [Nocardioides sp. Root151]|uniref:hypothetical protein n=1 Tax=Nocardioides sp. Root151 TaxID=1736475 RepID=UPI0007027D6A|nr:hypothetical protein [Nocardioides sp. Root151]KQZ67253.1 hypothetical protein ASD66_20010 [Nocardioides sp. Root151]